MSAEAPEAVEEQRPVVDPHADQEKDHPGDGRYVMIALILGAITAAEVATYYLDVSTAVLLSLLTPMMVAKFALVAMFFMHLKFDSPLFSKVFVAGIVLAVTVYIVVLTTFGFFSG